ncbi:MAG: flippase [Gemmatimonadota bacterium]|nr:MAG: flippase [Gemmatimonadota bacterium]
MFSELKRLLKHTSIYGLGDIVGRSISFILIPLYTHHLSTAEYGVMALAYVFIGFVNVLYIMGLNTAFLRFFVAERDKEGRKTLFSTVVIFLGCTSFLGSCCLWFASPAVAALLFGNSMYVLYVRLMALILFIDTLAQFPLLTLRALEKSKSYAAMTVIRFALTVGLNLYFVLFLRRGVEGILLSNLFASLSIFILLVPISVRYLKKTVSVSLLKQLLQFGLPLIPAVLCVLVIDLSDRYLLEHFSGLEEVGLYSLGYRLGMIMTLFVSAFRIAWPPFFLSVAEQNDAKNIYASVFTYFVLAGAVFFLGVTLYLRIVLHLFVGEVYWEASRIVPVILLSYLFYGMYVNFIVGVYITKKTKPVPYVTGFAAGVNILFNLLLIPKLGMMGAALATLMAYMSMALFLYLINTKVFPIPYEMSRLCKISLAAVIIFVTNIFLTSSKMGVELVLKSLLMVGFLCILFGFRFFQTGEFSAFKKMIRKT